MVFILKEILHSQQSEHPKPTQTGDRGLVV
jgi:hypothetical protein